MAAPSIRGFANDTAWIFSRDVPVPVPPEAMPGDLLLAVIFGHGNTTAVTPAEGGFRSIGSPRTIRPG